MIIVFGCVFQAGEQSRWPAGASRGSGARGDRSTAEERGAHQPRSGGPVPQRRDGHPQVRHGDMKPLFQTPMSVLQSFITRVCVSGTRLTAWAAWRRWWTRTSASWRIWAICADRCDCWRRGTTSTCSAPASWRRSSAEPTPSARSSTPTRDRWADAERFPESCHPKRYLQTNEWWMFVFLRPTRWAPNTRQRPWRLRSGSLSTRTSTTNMRPFWRRERYTNDHSHHMRWNDNDYLTVALWMCVMQKLISERDTLRETTEELRCAQVQQQCLTGLTHTAS